MAIISSIEDVPDEILCEMAIMCIEDILRRDCLDTFRASLSHRALCREGQDILRDMTE